MEVPDFVKTVGDFVYRYFLLFAALASFGLASFLYLADSTEYFWFNMALGVVWLILWILQSKSDGVFFGDNK